jgi:hypothetical protein
MRLTACRLLALLLFCAVPAYAQFDTASLVGTVRDTSGAVTPDTTVTLTSAETGVSLTRTTNADGLPSRWWTACKCRSAPGNASICRWPSAP